MRKSLFAVGAFVGLGVALFWNPLVCAFRGHKYPIRVRGLPGTVWMCPSCEAASGDVRDLIGETA